MKRVLSLVLALTLLVSLMVGCGKTEETATDSGTAKEAGTETTKDTKKSEPSKADPKEMEPLDFAVVLRDAEVSPADVLIYQELEEETGVKINWLTSPEAGWEEKRALLFASNDLPDAFFGNQILTDEDVLKYGSQGMLIPLEDYITPEIMPNLSATFEKYPDLKKAIIAPDGHIYGLPSFDNGSVTTTTRVHYINKDWLEAVNMDVPTTTEEYYQVLKAFKEQDANGNGDPNDEIPLTFQKSSNYISDFFGSFGLIEDVKTRIDVQDGKVVFTAADERYKKAIEYFNMMFQEGLIDQEAFTQDSKAYKAKLKSEERIVGSFQSWRSTGWANSDEDDDYIPVSPLEGPDGYQFYPERINGLKTKGSFAVTHMAEDPAYIMAWVDHIYEPLMGLQTSYASKVGVHLDDPDGDGKYVYILDGNRENRTGIIPQGRERIDNVTPEAAAMLAEKPKHLIEKHMLDQYYNEYYTGEHYPKVFYTLEEIERLSILNTDIIGYVDEMYAKWMQIGGIEEEWDAYLQKLDEMGLQEFIKIKQDAYDRFYN